MPSPPSRWSNLLVASLIPLAAVLVFGPAVWSAWPVGDDGWQTHRLAETFAEEGGLGGALRALVFEAAGAGHFKPTQDVLSALAHHWLGPERWTAGVLSFYLLLHACSGLLLASIARRTGLDQSASMAAGLLFVLHPAVDESMSAVLFGPNVPGLCATLAALRCWLPLREGTALHRSRLIVVGTALVFLAMGCNLVFGLTAPALLGLSILGRESLRSPVRRLLIPWSVLLVAGAAMAWLRWQAQGTVLTTMSSYRAITPEADLFEFLRQLWRQVILLEPSATHRMVASEMAPSSGGVPLPLDASSWSPWPLLGGLLAGLGCFMVGRRGGPSPSMSARIHPLSASILLLVTTSLPYLLFLGRIAPNRYAYPTLAGSSLLAVTVVTMVLRPWLRSPRARDLIMGTATAIVLCLWLPVTLEGVRGIRAGQEVAARMTRSIADDLADEPKVTIVSVLDAPRQAEARMGWVYPYPGHLRSMVSTLLERPLFRQDDSLLSARWSGALDAIDPRTIAVFTSDRHGRPTRLPRFKVDPAGPHARALIEEHRGHRLAHESWAFELLRDGSPRTVRQTLEVLTRHPADSARQLLPALEELGRARPTSEMTERLVGAGLAASFDEAIAIIRDGPHALPLAAPLAAGLSTETVRSLLASVNARQDTESWLALALGLDHREEITEWPEPVLDVLPFVPAAGSERQAWRQLLLEERILRASWRQATRPVSALARAMTEQQERSARLGIDRPDLLRAMERLRLWIAATSSEAEQVMRLDGEEASLAQRGRPWRLRLVPPSMSGTYSGDPLLLTALLNDDERLLPGGAAPTAAWVAVEDLRTGVSIPMLLPASGVPAGHGIWLPVRGLRAGSPADFRITLRWLGRNLSR